jgi:hypothetical protein
LKNAIATLGGGRHTKSSNETVLARAKERATNDWAAGRNINGRRRRNHLWGVIKTNSRRIGRRLRHNDVISEDSVLRGEKTALNGTCRPEDNLDNIEIVHETVVS